MRGLLDRYMGNAHDRTAAATLGSLVIYTLIGISKLILGVYLLSVWFITNALYYLLLCAVRGQALRMYTAARGIENSRKRYDLEFVVYRHGGIFICLLGISYFLVCLRMYLVGDATLYSGCTVYLVATVAFTKMGFAIHGIVIHRHLKNPIISTLKIINFIDAVVAIVVTQCTLLKMQAAPQAVSSSAWFGMGCSALFVLIGILMLIKKKKYPQNESHKI